MFHKKSYLDFSTEQVKQKPKDESNIIQDKEEEKPPKIKEEKVVQHVR